VTPSPCRTATRKRRGLDHGATQYTQSPEWNLDRNGVAHHRTSRNMKVEKRRRHRLVELTNPSPPLSLFSFVLLFPPSTSLPLHCPHSLQAVTPFPLHPTPSPPSTSWLSAFISSSFPPPPLFPFILYSFPLHPTLPILSSSASPLIGKKLESGGEAAVVERVKAAKKKKTKKNRRDLGAHRSAKPGVKP